MFALAVNLLFFFCLLAISFLFIFNKTILKDRIDKPKALAVHFNKTLVTNFNNKNNFISLVVLLYKIN